MTRGAMRLVFGLASILLVPTFGFVGLARRSNAVAAHVRPLEEGLAAALARSGIHRLTCGAQDGDGLGLKEAEDVAEDLRSSAGDLLGAALTLSPRRANASLIDEEMLDLILEGRLPLSRGFSGVYRESLALHESLSPSAWAHGLCRDPDPEFGAAVDEAEGRLASLREYGKKEEAEALEEAIRKARADRLKEPDGREYAEAWKAEEARSQAVYAEIRGKLVEHQAALERAWQQFERDRPKVAAVAWTLGILELVGWALGLAILPGEIRTLKAQWRARREAQARKA